MCRSDFDRRYREAARFLGARSSSTSVAPPGRLRLLYRLLRLVFRYAVLVSRGILVIVKTAPKLWESCNNCVKECGPNVTSPFLQQ